MRTLLQRLFTFSLVLVSIPTRAGELSDFTQATMAEVVKIARAISVVQPYLDETKYIEYALGIYRAARRYDVDPNVLIAIGQTETAFRENLPEGGAGEWGICQIRKLWLGNKQFRAEFGRQTAKDLRHPAKNFLFAAWILRDLKDSVTSKTLPYWSFYNARKFENRFKYFLLVNKNLSTLRRYDAALQSGARALAAATQAGPSLRGGDIVLPRSSVATAPGKPVKPADPLAPAKTIVTPEARSALTVDPREPRSVAPAPEASRRVIPNTANTSTSSLAEVTRNTYWSPDPKLARPGTRTNPYSAELDRYVAD